MSQAPPPTLGMVNHFRSGVHRIVETEQSEFLRKTLDLDSVFTVYNERSHNWSVAYWLNRSKGTFIELLAMRDPRDLDRNDIESLLMWRHGKSKSAQEFKREALEAEREFDRRNMEDQEEQSNRLKCLRSKLNHVQRDNPLLMHAIPFSIG